MIKPHGGRRMNFQGIWINFFLQNLVFMTVIKFLAVGSKKFLCHLDTPVAGMRKFDIET